MKLTERVYRCTIYRLSYLPRSLVGHIEEVLLEGINGNVCRECMRELKKGKGLV